jgi:hypothetical protein
MPLKGENFKRNNKLVFQILKLTCLKSNAWTWIQSFDRSSNGRKAWLALVAYYAGTEELNKRVKTAKEEISCLHYMDKRCFHLRSLSPSSRKTFM